MSKILKNPNNNKNDEILQLEESFNLSDDSNDEGYATYQSEESLYTKNNVTSDGNYGTGLKFINDKNQKMNQSKLFHHLTDFEKSLLIYKISLVFLAIIEGRQTKDEVTKKIMRDFDYRLIYDKLTEIYFKIKPIYKSSLEFFLYSEYNQMQINPKKIVIEAGLNLYIFLTSLYNFESEESEFKRFYNLFIKENISDYITKDNFIESNLNLLSIKKAMTFYKEHTGHIEILKEDQVQIVFFPKLNFFKNLTNEMILKFRRKCNSTSIQSKLNSLISEKDELYLTLKQLYRVENYLKELGAIKILFMYPKVFQYIGIFLGIIMNIFILVGYTTIGADPTIDILKNIRLFYILDLSSKYLLK
jgi:hypothetical protein